MSKKQLLIFVPLVIVLSTIIILLISLFTESPKIDNVIITSKTPTQILNQDQLLDDQTIDFSTFEFTVSGWIPNWGSPSGLNSLKNNVSKFNSISPVWYEVNTDGSLKSKYPANKKEMLAFYSKTMLYGHI